MEESEREAGSRATVSRHLNWLLNTGDAEGEKRNERECRRTNDEQIMGKASGTKRKCR